MKILVIGCGFIGRKIIKEYEKFGHEVIVVDKRLCEFEDIKSYQMDYASTNILNVIAEVKPDIVNFSSGIVTITEVQKYPLTCFYSDVYSVFRIIECCAKLNVKKFIFASSCAVYGNLLIPVTEDMKLDPLSYYGLNKETSENYLRMCCKNSSMKYTIFRYSNVYGTGINLDYPNIFVNFTKNILKEDGTPTIYGNGESHRDYISVNDVVAANVMAARSINETEFFFDNDTFNISSSENHSVKEIYSLICNCLRSTKEPVFAEAKDEESKGLYISNAKAILEGWSPKVRFINGLAATIQDIKERLAEREKIANTLSTGGGNIT